ncbi:MAG: GatB/YqeY domain-containing protein [Clostridiales bacterium]|jgi:uncharacterized protein YqeY|nr:GatB/YqeY domain-containing protein [Clostridiales bacterium]MDR2750935.1 GatB/YqeY domain-containing protein [Clostridiales bacterium]
MDLKATLLQDLKEALKSKDTLRKDTIQILRAAVLQVEKDTGKTLDDTSIVDVISKELKKRVDVMPDFVKSGRQDRITELEAQIVIIKSYLPPQLSPEEVLDIVKKAIDETGASSIKDMGKVMAAVGPALKGRADMKIVGDIVRKAVS